MQWRTAALIACTYALARRAGQSQRIHSDLFNDRYIDSLPCWRTGTMGTAPMVAIITHDRRPKIDRISLFRRILTVTRLMTLAGNKVDDPERTVQPLGRARRRKDRA